MDPFGLFGVFGDPWGPYRFLRHLEIFQNENANDNRPFTEMNFCNWRSFESGTDKTLIHRMLDLYDTYQIMSTKRAKIWALKMWKLEEISNKGIDNLKYDVLEVPWEN